MTTQHVTVNGGTIGYDLVGEGPLVILAPGLADTRASYRFLAPLLADAGFRVASVDLRGHGDSSLGWDSWTRTDTAEDLVQVVEALGGGPVVVVGQSFSGGSATIAAATRPDLVAGIVEIAPFTRPPSFGLGAFLCNDHRYRTGALLLARFAVTGRPGTWAKYLDVAYPGRKPADWDIWLAGVTESLRRAGGVDAARGMLRSAPTDSAAKLPAVQCPALVIMGAADSDFADPAAEGAAIVAALPEGLGSLHVVDGAGHYPHAQYPDEVAAAMLPFLHRVLA